MGAPVRRPGQGLLLLGAMLAGLPPLPEGCPILEALPPAPPKLPKEPDEGGDMVPRNRHARRKAAAKARRAGRVLR